MLKKANKFLASLILGVCMLLFCNVTVHLTKTAGAVEVPNLEDESGENWSYDYETLTLTGVDWVGTLEITENTLEINLSGTNKISIDSIYYDALNLSDCDVLTFSGTGSLEIVGRIIGNSEIILEDDLQALVGSEIEPVTDSFTLSQFSDVSYLKIEPAISQSSEEYGNSTETEEDKTEETKSEVPITTSGESTTIVRTDLDSDYHYDLSKIFGVPENCGEITYKHKDNNDWAKTDKNLIIQSAGTYEIKIEVAENENYLASSKEHSLIVNKMENSDTVSVSAKSWIYGGVSNVVYEFKNTLDGFEKGISRGESTIEYYTDEEYNNKYTQNDGVPTDAGTYYAKITVPDDGFVNEKVFYITAQMLPKEVAIIWDEDNFTYNGQVQTIHAKYKDINGNFIDFAVTLDEEEFKNPDTYTATVSFKYNETNYAISSSDSHTKSYTIKKIQLKLKVNDLYKIYNREPSEYVLSVRVVSGSIVGGEVPYELSFNETITKDTAIGEYQILATAKLTDYYDVTFEDGYFYVINEIYDLVLDSWYYGDSENSPSARAHVYQEDITYTYYKVSSYGKLIKLSEKPTTPGHYRVKAEIKNEYSYNQATAEKEFDIYKIRISSPAKDNTIYVYDGQDKYYGIQETDIYKVDNRKQRDAGTYIVRLTLKNSEIYEWEDSDKTYIEYVFVINKKQISIPNSVNTYYKYTGNPIKYSLEEGSDYQISSSNIQTEPGRYVVTLSLIDDRNIEWENGSSEDINYDFVIYRNSIVEPTTTSATGTTLNEKPVTIIESSGNGISPDSELKVTVIKDDDKQLIKSIRESLELSKYDKVFKVYDVELVSDGNSIQPDGTITLKMKIPAELVGAKFVLYHIHTDANGEKVVSEIKYNGVSDDGYIMFQVDKLSEFAFVYEQESLIPLVVVLAILCSVLLVLLIIQLISLLKQNGKKMARTTLASAVPIFFVTSEVAISIVLGVLSLLLIVGNVILFWQIRKKNKVKLADRHVYDLGERSFEKDKNKKAKSKKL